LNETKTPWAPLLGTVLLALGFWFATFYLRFSIFWIKISLSALILAALAFRFQPDLKGRLHFDRRALAIGVASAAALYLIFWAGKLISTAVLPFAEGQIGAVYGKGEGTPAWAIALLLLCVTGPCEELYWRGYLQHQLMRRFGDRNGWLLGTAIYAGVHVWSFNFMLIGAAAVAGAFWGYMYWRLGRLGPVIVSHALWSAFIFSVMPVP
jgi:membrane protease YdiL (CAAX protease family)